MFGAFEAAKIVEKYGDKHGDKHGKIWGICPARKICRSQIGLAKSMFLFSLVSRSKKHLLLQISHGGWVAPPVDLVLQSPMPYYSGNKFPQNPMVYHHVPIPIQKAILGYISFE